MSLGYQYTFKTTAAIAAAASAGETLSPDPVSLSLVIPTPSITREQTLTPSSIAVPIVVPNPDVSVESLVTLNLQVASGNDDADETESNIGFAVAGVEVLMTDNTSGTSARRAGFRFANVTIPQGATITAATFEPNVSNTTFDDPSLNIHAHDVDDSPDFAASADVTGRVLTTANTLWSATGIGAGFKTSPDIAAVIQEIIDRPGWASGNAIMIITKPTLTVNRGFRAVGYDGTPANAAKLNITYAAAGDVLSPSPVIIPLVLAGPSVSFLLGISPSPITVPAVLPTPTITAAATNLTPSPVAIPISVLSAAIIFPARSLSPTPAVIRVSTTRPNLTRFTEHSGSTGTVGSRTLATIYDPSGAQVGVVTPLKYKINRYTNRVGNWSCEIPVDEFIGLLPSPRVIGANWKISISEENNSPLHQPSEGYLLYQGVVETREHKIGAGGQAVLAMTGSFRTIALVKQTIGRGYEHPTTLSDFIDEVVGDLIEPDGDAIYSSEVTQRTISSDLSLEFLTRFAALLKGLTSARFQMREGWDHDRLEIVPYDGPPKPTVNGNMVVLRKAESDEDVYQHENGSTGVGLIAGEPTIRYDGSEIINRIIPYGQDTVANNSEGGTTANLTLFHATAVGPYAVQSDTYPDGTTYYYLEDAESIAAYGLNEVTLTRSDIRNPNDDQASRTQAANVLYWVAVNELIKKRSEKVSVSIGPVANGSHIWLLPGDQTWVKYRSELQTLDGPAVWIDLEKRFLVSERHDESHPSGVRRVEFIVTAAGMEYEVPGLPEEVNPFDPDGPLVPGIGLPPLQPFPPFAMPDFPEFEIPEFPPPPEAEVPEFPDPPEPGYETPPPGPGEGGGVGSIGMLRLTEADVLEYWDGTAWMNVEARLSTEDPGGGATWLEPP